MTTQFNVRAAAVAASTLAISVHADAGITPVSLEHTLTVRLESVSSDGPTMVERSLTYTSLAAGELNLSERLEWDSGFEWGNGFEYAYSSIHSVVTFGGAQPHDFFRADVQIQNLITSLGFGEIPEVEIVARADTVLVFDHADGPTFLVGGSVGGWTPPGNNSNPFSITVGFDQIDEHGNPLPSVPGPPDGRYRLQVSTLVETRLHEPDTWAASLIRSQHFGFFVPGPATPVVLVAGALAALRRR